MRFAQALQGQYPFGLPAPRSFVRKQAFKNCTHDVSVVHLSKSILLTDVSDVAIVVTFADNAASKPGSRQLTKPA